VGGLGFDWTLAGERLEARHVFPESFQGAPGIVHGGIVAAALDEIVSELSEADRQERIEMLIDFAKNLPPLPDRLAALKDAEHRVEECQSPVFLFVEADGDRVEIHADAPIEAPTVRGFVAILVEGLNEGKQ